MLKEGSTKQSKDLFISMSSVRLQFQLIFNPISFLFYLLFFCIFVLFLTQDLGQFTLIEQKVSS